MGQFGPGPIGLCAMQMAKSMGAKSVIVIGRRHRFTFLLCGIYLLRLAAFCGFI